MCYLKGKTYFRGTLSGSLLSRMWYCNVQGSLYPINQLTALFSVTHSLRNRSLNIILVGAFSPSLCLPLQDSEHVKLASINCWKFFKPSLQPWKYFKTFSQTKGKKEMYIFNMWIPKYKLYRHEFTIYLKHCQ